jgi:hypothetical protein
MKNLRLAMSPITKNVYAGQIKSNGYEWEEGKQDVSEDFKRCVVNYCSESEVFWVDNMKFKVTCERIN